MKLILSSYDFQVPESRNVIIENLPKDISECKVLFIPNGSPSSEMIESGYFHKPMCKYGFKNENILVFDHTKADNFRKLESLDIIYVSGGNTFTILDKIRKCGFDKDIIDYVKSGVTYIGGSAGAHIITQNIEHVAQYDENNVGITDFNGLGLYDGILICHYTYERKRDLDELIAQGKYKVEYLTDSDSLVYTD